MKRITFKVFFTVIISLLGEYCFAQPSRVFERLTVADGLANGNVQCIVQDSRGYIWMGTYDGLNRYNGHAFDLFVKESGNLSSLQDNNIYSLMVDSRGDLWVGSKYGGLARFNRKKETFETWMHDTQDASSISDNWVFSIYEDRSGQIYVGTSNGLNRIVFKPGETNGRRQIESFERYYYGRESDRKIQRITELQDSSLYLSTSKGILVFDTLEKAYSRSYFNEGDTTFKDKADIAGGILATTKDSLLIGSYAGLYELSLLDGKVTSRIINSSGPAEISRINDMIKDRSGNLWVGCNKGLRIYDASSGSQWYTHSYNDPNSLPNKHVQTIYEDRSGIIWLGTRSGGVGKYDPNKIKFPLTYPEINLADDQGKRSFLTAYTTADGHEWIGNDSGLFEFSGDSLVNSFVPGRDSLSISRGGVTGVLELDNGELMIATWGGGLHRLNRKTGEFYRYGYAFNEGMKTNNQLSCCITDMVEHEDGVFWLSTIYGFLERFDTKKGTFKSFKIGEWIWDIEKDERTNTLFLATENGLVTFDIANEKSTNYTHREADQNSIDHNRVWTVFKDSENKIWVGTYKGLEEFNSSEQSFHHHTDPTLDRLSVYTMEEDATGKLWLGTQSGISVFDPEDGSFRHFGLEDGAVEESKNSYRDSQGRMFFGGIGGFVSFYPDSIKINTSVPDVVFTDLKIFNESVRPGGNALSGGSLDYARKVTLPYSSKVFSIEFAALNFSSPNKNNYAYKLEGFDEDWNHSGAKKSASYTNLDPGEYIFKVRASNNDQVWNKEGASILLTITPPFWGTWWFRTLLIVLILVIIMLWFQVRFYQIKKKKGVLEKLVRRRTEELEVSNRNLAEQKEKVLVKNRSLERMAEEVHRSSEMRTRFFTNVSHEFRTPLTLISAPIEKLLDETRHDSRIHNRIELVAKNSRRLLRLIDQLLDVSKIDAGFMKMNLIEGDIETFIGQVFDSFVYKAAQRGIQYNFTSHLASPVCVFDVDKLEKITYNLLSNAFKFTSDYGRINLDLSGETDETGLRYAVISIRDNGIGVKQKDIVNIFERFVRKSYSETEKASSGGIGLSLAKSLAELHRGGIEIQSVEGKGTCFTIKVGVHRSMYAEDEILSERVISDEDLLTETPERELATDGKDEILAPRSPSYAPVVLIVEDNPDLNRFMAEELNGSYRVLVALNGREGWEKCRKYLPDLVISDVMMPEMNGIELCTLIKKEPETCHIPTMLLTAKSTVEDQRVGLSHGADDYISKPFNMGVLSLKIKNILETRARMQKRLERNGFVPELANADHRDKVLLKSCVETIREEIANPDLDARLLCERAGLSRSLLYAKIKSVTGQSVNGLVKSIRLKVAADLILKYSDRSMGEIYLDVGFSSQSQFNRSFKEKFGIPPTEYRKRQLNAQD